MALVRDIVFKPGLRLSKILSLEAKAINLKPVKSVIIKYDPLRNDVGDIRNFNFFLCTSSPLKSNPKCLIKTEILSDRSEHSVTFNLENGQKILFKCGNLNTLDILQLVNKHITPLAPKEEIFEIPTEEKKKARKGSHGKKRRV